MKPVAVTLGDACGIGPEIVVRALGDAGVMARHPAFVIGPIAAVEQAVAAWAPHVAVRRIAAPGEHQPAAGRLDVLEAGQLPPGLAHGTVSAAAGRAAFEAVALAIDLANAGDIAALCTAPVHKAALAAAGVPYPGHTEMLAELSAPRSGLRPARPPRGRRKLGAARRFLESGSADTAMMLLGPGLRTLLVTVHCSMLQAVAQLSVERELRIIRLAHRALRELGLDRPRIAVAGLNPHAGEGGLFGREDLDIIAPAIALARAEGIDATGPHPGDTVFMQARRGQHDLVVAQYHDQGLIPIKLLGLEDGVNVTVRLPFVRTSPDHGTAFDIAGLGIADPRSLVAALRTAHELAALRAGRC